MPRPETPPDMPFPRELECALEAAERARVVIMEAYATHIAIPNAPISITNEADHQAQWEIVRHILDEFPQDGVKAEEQTSQLRGRTIPTDRLWIVDPIDGSRGFARKNDQFSVMIAFQSGGQVQVGVVVEPAYDRWTWATRGGGCWTRTGEGEPVRCHVSDVPRLALATLARSLRDPGKRPSQLEIALGPKAITRTYSAGVKLALVARGEADVYASTSGFHDWDIAAGHILVEEAGGRMSDSWGDPIVYGVPGAHERDGTVASNGVLHDEVIAAFPRWGR